MLPPDFHGNIDVPAADYRVGLGASSCSLQVTEVSREDPNFNVEMRQVGAPLPLGPCRATWVCACLSVCLPPGGAATAAAG